MAGLGQALVASASPDPGPRCPDWRAGRLAVQRAASRLVLRETARPANPDPAQEDATGLENDPFARGWWPDTFWRLWAGSGMAGR